MQIEDELYCISIFDSAFILLFMNEYCLKGINIAVI